MSSFPQITALTDKGNTILISVPPFGRFGFKYVYKSVISSLEAFSPTKQNANVRKTSPKVLKLYRVKSRRLFRCGVSG